MESEECLSELRLELMDLARLAHISFIDWFAVGQAKNKMLKLSEPIVGETPETDTVKANIKYLNHMINYDQNGKPKRTRRATESKTVTDDTNGNDTNDDNDYDKNLKLFLENSNLNFDTDVHKSEQVVNVIKPVLRKKVYKKNAVNNLKLADLVLPSGVYDTHTAFWKIPTANQCKTEDYKFLVVDGLKFFSIQQKKDRSFICALCGLQNVGTRRNVQVEEMCIFSSCFVCYRRLNYEATHDTGAVLSRDDNARKIKNLIELITVRVSDRIKAPLLFFRVWNECIQLNAFTRMHSFSMKAIHEYIQFLHYEL